MSCGLYLYFTRAGLRKKKQMQAYCRPATCLAPVRYVFVYVNVHLHTACYHTYLLTLHAWLLCAEASAGLKTARISSKCRCFRRWRAICTFNMFNHKYKEKTVRTFILMGNFQLFHWLSLSMAFILKCQWKSWKIGSWIMHQWALRLPQDFFSVVWGRMVVKDSSC